MNRRRFLGGLAVAAVALVTPWRPDGVIVTQVWPAPGNVWYNAGCQMYVGTPPKEIL